MGTKVQRDVQQRKTREERSVETINVIESSIDYENNVSKSFVAPQRETNADEARYMYLQGLYITLHTMCLNDHHSRRLVQKMIDANRKGE